MVSSLFQDVAATQSTPNLCPHVILAADDVTGAFDSAAQFARHGHGAKVIVRGGKAPEPVWAFSYSTRDHSPEAAGAAVERHLRALQPEVLRQTTYFQKIDSAGRGPIASCILAAAAVVQPEIILCAPSFPALGRTVTEGALQVRDIAGQDTSIQLHSMFPDEVQARIANIPSGSPAHVQAAMVEAHHRGQDLWLCDSQEDADVRALVQAAHNLPLRILWSGSGGLAAALASAIALPCHPHSAAFQPAGSAYLLICGTTHPVTRLQMRRVHATSSDSILKMQWGTTSVAEVRAAFMQMRPNTLILTGGDTAWFVLDGFECGSIEVGGELAPGIPWGRIVGGLADGCHIITKSGGFGGESSLADVVNFCTRGRV